MAQIKIIDENTEEPTDEVVTEASIDEDQKLISDESIKNNVEKENI